MVTKADICPSDYFEKLFKSVKDARNDALHQGAVARHLASRLIEIALILEESLGSRLTTIEYLMVKQPVVAEDWQTLAMIRQTMLANAFSYLPYKSGGKWFWISDYALASHLSELRTGRQKVELAKALKTVNREWCSPKDISILKDQTPQEALTIIRSNHGVPLLVLEDGHLIGIVTAADLLR